MINVKKGTAHSLQQSDFVGPLSPGAGVVAGMLVRKDVATGTILPGVLNQGDEVNEQVGFAITNQNEGDAIESGKIGVYALDGGSVIETDQVTPTTVINATNFPAGTRVAADAANPGMVKAWATGDRVVGTVDGAPRSVYVGQAPITLLAIKLGV